MKSGIVTDINIHDSTIIVKRKIRIIPKINNTHNITASLIE